MSENACHSVAYHLVLICLASMLAAAGMAVFAGVAKLIGCW